MEADEADQIDAARSIDDMLDGEDNQSLGGDSSGADVDVDVDIVNGVDGDRLDTPLTPDTATRSQPPALSPVAHSPLSTLPTTSPPSNRQRQSRQPRQFRQSRQILCPSDSESDNSDMDADTEDAAPYKAKTPERSTALNAVTPKTSTKTPAQTQTRPTEPDSTRPKPHRQARVSAANNVPRKSVPHAIPRMTQPTSLDDDTDTTEDIPLHPLTPMPPAKAILAVQLKVNLEIEVVIKARICGDVLLSVL